jgi:glycosyltransferase involved in cell wall biosynthesis
LRRRHPDLVHLVLAPSLFAYAPLFSLLPLPTVVSLAGEMRYVRHFYGPAKRRAVLYAVRRAGALVVCSADEMENLRVVAAKAAGKATVLDNFTDTARFAPAIEKELLVTFAARLHPEKGALLFLDAAAQVAGQVPDVRFALMGKGEQEAAVRERLARSGLDGRLTRGFQTDLAPLFARSSIFVSCQHYENLGSSSLLEAMASGNAVVATDVGQTWQIVDHSVGIRVPPEASALAAATVDLLADRPRLAALGRAARQRVLDRYGPGPYVDRLMDIYRRVLG